MQVSGFYDILDQFHSCFRGLFTVIPNENVPGRALLRLVKEKKTKTNPRSSEDEKMD